MLAPAFSLLFVLLSLTLGSSIKSTAPTCASDNLRVTRTYSFPTGCLALTADADAFYCLAFNLRSPTSLLMFSLAKATSIAGRTLNISLPYAPSYTPQAVPTLGFTTDGVCFYISYFVWSDASITPYLVRVSKADGSVLGLVTTPTMGNAMRFQGPLLSDPRTGLLYYMQSALEFSQTCRFCTGEGTCSSQDEMCFPLTSPTDYCFAYAADLKGSGDVFQVFSPKLSNIVSVLVDEQVGIVSRQWTTELSHDGLTIATLGQFVFVSSGGVFVYSNYGEPLVQNFGGFTYQNVQSDPFSNSVVFSFPQWTNNLTTVSVVACQCSVTDAVTLGNLNFEWKSPTGITIDDDGRVYVVSNGTVLMFDSQGRFISSFGSYANATDLCILNGTVYILDTQNNRIAMYGTRSGKYLGSFGSYGAGSGQLSGPMGIACHYSGAIYVADTLNNRIQLFNATGGFVSSWGSQGTGPGQFFSPYDVAVDFMQNVYVADYRNGRVQILMGSGTYVSQRLLKGPVGVAVDVSYNLYVTDYTAKSVVVFPAKAAHPPQTDSGISLASKFDGPFRVAIDTNWTIYVTDTTANQVTLLGCE